MVRDSLVSDGRLVRQTLGGRREAFDVLVARYHDVVRAVAWAHMGSHAEAEDAAQEAFVQAFQSLHTLRRGDRLAPWLATIARRTCYGLVRSAQRRSRAEAGAVQPDTAPPADFERQETAEVVRQQLDTLPPEQREILLLRYYAGKRVREVAGILAISPDAAAKRLQRAREALGARLLEALEQSQERERGRATERVSKICGAVALVQAPWESSAAPATGASLLGLSFGKSAIVAVLAVLGLTGAWTVRYAHTWDEREAEEVPTVEAPEVPPVSAPVPPPAPPKPKPVAQTLTVGRLHEPDAAALMETLAAEYRQSRPDLMVRVLASNNKRDLTQWDTEGEPLPDILALPVELHRHIHELPYCVSEDLIVPVEELAGDGFVGDSGHFTSLWECIEYEGRHWGVPFYAESYGMIMRRRSVPPHLMQAWPESWQDLTGLLLEATRDTDEDGTPDVWGLALRSRNDLAALCFLPAAQLGARWWDGERFIVAQEPALRRGFDLLMQLSNAGVIAPGPSSDYAMAYVQSWQFNDHTGHRHVYPGRHWSRTTEYRVIPFAGVGNQRTMPVLNLYLAVKRSTPEKQAACWDFVQWATSADAQAVHAVAAKGCLPIHDRVADSEMFQDLVVKMPHLAVFVDTLRSVGRVCPFVRNGNEAFEFLGEAVEKAWEGEIALQEALATAEARMNRLAGAA